MNTQNRCPKCLEGRLKGWQELNEEEREVVKRLPGSAETPEKERKTYRWCPRCWFEAKGGSREA